MDDRALITAAELAGLIAGSRHPVVLDARWNLAGPRAAEDYRRGHIPTAAFVDLDTDLAGAPGPAGRHPLPDAERFEAAMRRVGVVDDRLVVVYDAASGGSGAARAWWCLRYFGHPAVRVLDGGYGAWTGGAYRIDEGVVTPAPGNFTARPGNMPTLTPEAAVRMVERGGILIDARAAERFRGEREPIDPVAGHIPGARNLPSAQLIDDNGQLLAPGTLRERFDSIGASGDLVVGAYCGSGVVAAQTVLAAAVAGFDVALYPGSWSEWITDPNREVALGSDA